MSGHTPWSEIKKSPEKRESDLIAWVDIETTGLQPASANTILEIAIVITDGNLRAQHMGPSVVINPGKSWWEVMDPYVQEMHTHNGLWEECMDSSKHMGDAEYEILTFLKEFEDGTPGLIPLGGSTISFDRSYLETWMPDLNAHLHYRNIDVTSFKETWRRWLPEVYARFPEKIEAHRAQADIIESLNMLRIIRENVMEGAICLSNKELGRTRNRVDL